MKLRLSSRWILCWLMPLAAGGLLSSAVAAAEVKPAVVELFTSQGCSSCPPADALLTRLADRPGLIALSLPVDYWDYIGWKDTLASPLFTQRQKGYAKARGDGRVYTPQAVIDGLQHEVGSNREAILSAVDSNFGRSGAMTVPVNLKSDRGRLAIDVGASAADATPEAAVWLMRVASSRTVAIGRGENHGKTLTYTNVVRSVTRLGDWTGAAEHFEAPLADAVGSDADRVVVLVQAGSAAHPGVILGAAEAR